MQTRRGFLLTGAAAAIAARGSDYVSRRPPLAERKFTSEAVEAKIVEVRKAVADPEIGWLFENCFPNTLDTTIRFGELGGRPDTFVITGDINAMWLRDSSAQVWPYLPLAKDDRKLKTMLVGVVNRQVHCIHIDPYANAFNYGPTGSQWDKDLTTMKPELHERKWEVDSLCYPIRLAHGYWKVTGDASIFDPQWQGAARLIVKTFREQQRLNGPGPYKFQRVSAIPSDSLPGEGYGNPLRPCGLIVSSFRPSDDATIFPFLIPSNLFAVTSLRQLAEIYEAELPDKQFARECRALADQVAEAVQAHGVSERPKYGKTYAFETDGYGNHLFIDDCGIPSLLSLPYLGCCSASDPLYLRTRAWALSSDNPYYFQGKAASGLGSPHAGPDMIWPMGIIAQALTSGNRTEIANCLRMLKTTTAGTGFIHEGFNKDDAANYTRPWFAWANTLFGELILTLLQKHPDLLRS